MSERVRKTGAGIVLWVRGMSAFELATELKSRGLSHFGGLEMLRLRLLNYEVELLPKRQEETPPAIHSNSEPSSKPFMPLAQKLAEEKLSKKNLEIIRSWGLTFGGRGNLDPENFLAKIAQLQEEYSSIRDQDLLDALPFLLVASVNLWYRLEHFRWQTWQDFATSLRQKKFFYREITGENEHPYTYKTNKNNNNSNHVKNKMIKTN